MPIGLNEKEGNVERDTGRRHESELERRVGGAGYRKQVVRQDQHQNRHRDQHREEGVGPFHAEFALALADGTDHDAKARESMHNQHYNGMDESRINVGLGSPPSMRETIKSDLNHRDGERKHQRAEWFAHAERHDLGMVDGRDHVAEQHHDQQQRQRLQACFADKQPDCYAQRRQQDCVRGNSIDGGSSHARP